jgi:serine/threonine protein kinase
MPDAHVTASEWSEPDLRTVAGYRLLRRIGSGGMSTVFLSYDVNTDSPVAVKLLADHLAHSREFVSRFYREAHLSRLLSNPFLVRGISSGYDPEVAKHYLILEYVDGPTAQIALNRIGRFPVGTAVKIGLDIAQALSFLHSRQYIHRDVKPDNILLHPSGTAKLVDLGLAKRLNDDAHLTSVSQGVGTSYYMSYEQSVNANFVDGRSDIFALGATLYHLLAGDVPFQGATHEEIIKGKHDDMFRPLAQHNPDVPRELTDIIARTLVRDPRSRFQTVDELAEALKSTRLATQIPPLPQVDENDRCGNPITVSDAPTRADLNTIGRGGISPTVISQNPPTASFCPSKIATSSSTSVACKNRPGGSSRWVLGVLAAASALGLGGLLAVKNHPHLFYSQPPVTSTYESREPNDKGGLPIPVPQ